MIKQRIKEVAEAKGISQGKLSRMADVGYSTIVFINRRRLLFATSEFDPLISTTPAA